ncbi:Irregular chiasm C-roughest protein like [Argiope bruennichi]|uniref:Irregular chiasm C-roughest protein like n=1 Tax=Argiope bruennichi TaxID=94029 RepID=A0A8T0FP95_ARGBR|nr:Irregular chiasm C-roughest protein like [Argiope bruennichi]
MAFKRIILLTVFVLSALGKGEGNQQYFRVKPKDTDIVEGQSADLQCHIGNQAGAVQWSKDGFVLGFDPDIPGYPRYSMIVDERRGVYNLRLRGVQLDDEGEYQCQVGPEHKNHPIRAAARVTVLDPPGIPEIEGYQEGDIVQVGDTLTLACITRGGNPQAELIWYRDNVQVDMSFTTSGREVTNIRTFTVDKTDNNAVYRCEASNSVTYHPRIATVKLSVQCEYTLSKTSY